VKQRTIVTFGSLLLALSFAACRQETTPGPDVWAVVNGKEIKREDVDKYFRSRFASEDQQPSQEESLSIKLNILDELVNNEILLERARKLGLEAADGEVEDKFIEFKSPFTEDELQRQLKERGVTVDDLKRDLRRQISIQKLMNREIVSKVTITDQDITDFYNQNRAQFNVAETQYRLAEIVVTPRKDPLVRNRKNDDAGSDVEARRKIQMLYERLGSGADFAQLAMDYSEDSSAANGGDLGYNPESAFRNPKQVPPELARIILALKPGELSNVITTADSYRILKMIAREPAGQRELSDAGVQNSIRERLRDRKVQLLRAAFLAVVRDEAKVVNYLAQQVLESSGKLPEATPAPKESSPPGKN
jgi:peptidyl-prolyl cis-trans isomerase SurA